MVALRRIVRFLHLADRQIETTHELSAAQLFVLHSLFDHPATSLGELATRTLTDQSSVSIVVAKLVDKKLIARTLAPDDRRRSELQLTERGKMVVLSAPRLPQPGMIAAIEKLPADRRAQLVHSREGLAAAIGANELEPRMLFEDEPRSARGRTRGAT
jgi:MarR family transcriptional regulator, organic hydroperoxide resistance regulator